MSDGGTSADAAEGVDAALAADAGSGLDTGPGLDTGSGGDATVDAGSGADAGQGSASCTGLGTICAGQGCCACLAVPDGSFLMGRSNNGNDAHPDGFDDEQPEHDVTVSSFTLERFEVTVGRMRRFVDQYSGQAPRAGLDRNYERVPPGTSMPFTFAESNPELT